MYDYEKGHVVVSSFIGIIKSIEEKTKHVIGHTYSQTEFKEPDYEKQIVEFVVDIEEDSKVTSVIFELPKFEETPYKGMFEIL